MLYAGEGILERFFSELPAYLTPSGYAQVNLAMNDYPDSPFVDRLRRWLGPAGESCPVLVLVLRQERREAVQPGSAAG